ncbi:MAG: hypothetical protein HZA35_00180 [Parcubacteria group bacterium]|nr:hypothetical protein [Parcubacteria group bacterium]
MSRETISSREMEEHIHYKEIVELEEPIQRLLDQLRPHLEKNEYRLIIGDDASGRIPTLIMRKVMDTIYAGLMFDVATIGFDSSHEDPDVMKRIYNSHGIKLFSGGAGIPSLYYNKELSGVEKQPEDLFAKVQPGHIVYELEDDDGPGTPSSEVRKRSREDVEILVKRLVGWYRHQLK